MLQVADYVSHAVFQLHERKDASMIKPIMNKFDHKAGIFHGLVHVGRGKAGCQCPACASRRAPGSYGDWLQPPAQPVD